MQRGIPAVVMRGGTSRGVFFHERDLPPTGPQRDRLLLEVLGSPEPTQADGLGGGTTSTSKVMIVAPATKGRADIEYHFAQVAVDEEMVDHVGNCGNLTAAVGAFAVDEGLVETVEPITTLLLHNRNTDTVVRAQIPVVNGRARVQGDAVVAGVHRSGAAIHNEYLSPNGAVFDRALPTGSPRLMLEVPGLGEIELSIVDVTNPVVFVEAGSLGITARETPQEAAELHGLFARAEAVRLAAIQHLGDAGHVAAVDGFSPHQPKVAAISAPHGDEGSVTLHARVVTSSRMHHAFPATALLCLGAASFIPGTIPHEIRSEGALHDIVTVQHGAGVVRVAASVELHDGAVHVQGVSIERTARRIMQGEILVRVRQHTSDVA